MNRLLAAVRGALGLGHSKTFERPMKDRLDRALADLAIERVEHAKLREAVRMMGLDPAKLSAYADGNGSFHAPKLLQCVNLDEVKLLKYHGTSPQLSNAYRSVWAELKLHQDNK
ncbi:hypothetical protein ABIC83_002414 [Roseateles asaccharophilus]|uniref:hypothetical protein n=1 Tax=Roseateles asaccharophilus TaxID=582607 RepID=UPI003837E83B